MFHGRTSSLLSLVLAATFLLIVAIGISGIARTDELESGEYAPRQVVWLMLGMGACALACFGIPYRSLKSISYPFFAVTIVLLVAVYFFPARQGARRWIPLGFMLMQPSEFAKIAYILALSQYLMFRKNHRTAFGLIPPFLMTAIPVVLILKEPDLGTALLFFPVMYALLFAAGARRWHLALSIVAGIVLLPALWQVMNAEQKSRVTALFLQRDGGEPETGDGYHLYQSKQLLALGGVWGSEFGGMPLEDPAAYHLPAGHTDFVYCLVGERWGLLGTLGVLCLFGIVVIAGLLVAARTRDPFGRLVATGIIAIITAQVLINTSMTVGLTPVTGLTLPLMSYGGSSLLTTGFAIGILLNIARDPGYDVAGQPFQFSS
ncbi:FtsW/RodA/SpoVE family cell cycle protein [Planctomicrobium sp. SH664]|uniref:FtsW/RodA/SpoVE family cell cycle protein n=1 Tax=Planctomicrobium sp. SH664 TaxID=3448125 RepID=UPI003F5C37D4